MSLPDYKRRAQLHRPANALAMISAVRELQRNKLKPRDIAEALKLPLPTVIELLFSKESHQCLS